MKKSKFRTCEICGDSLGSHYFQHVEVCKRVPLSPEVEQALFDYPDVSLYKFAEKWGCTEDFVRQRLRGTCWTKEKLVERGNAVRKKSLQDRAARQKEKYFSLSYISRKCRCGILLENHENKCRFCIDEENGITNYRVRYNLD